jgi:fumarylacetoacetate (FAA) hydrolase
MKLATLPGGSRDGRLVVVSRNLRQAVDASGIAATLQEALDDWTIAEPALEALFLRLQANKEKGAFAFDPSAALAPLPRAWQWLDASAFESHGALMAKVFGIDDPPRQKPLMYQGVSHRFYSPTEDVPFRSEADGIDFEGEFAVITDSVPMCVSADKAASHIRLIAQVNDWSLRAIAPVEMKTGFGWVLAKPPCSMAPVVVTPDELGRAWRNGRVALPLRVEWNGTWFGEPNGMAMGFSFPELVAHAAATRDLCAGTIIGSGTVSNANYREVGSTCVAERRGIETIDTGSPQTAFMKFGDRVRMEAKTSAGNPLFGPIDQRVVPLTTTN